MELTRRNLLVAGSALGVAAMVAGPAMLFAHSGQNWSVLGVAIFERGLEDSSPMAGRLAARLNGLETFDHDVSGLWLQRFGAGKNLDGRAIAGLTSVASLFCLEELLRDHGMRLVSLVRLDTAKPEIMGANAWRDRLIRSLAATDDPSLAIAAAISGGAPPEPLPGRPMDRYQALPRQDAVAWIIAPTPGGRRFGAFRQA